MKKILWIEDQANFILDHLEIFGQNLSEQEIAEVLKIEDILRKKEYLRNKNIFIEADFPKSCSRLFKEDFDTIILDVNFPSQYRDKDKTIIQQARKLFADAFASDKEEYPYIEQVFDEILLKKEYSGLLLFYLICLYYEKEKGIWNLSDIKNHICFFTANAITLEHFQNLLKQRFSNGYNLREGFRIRDYIENVKDNFWKKDDGIEKIKKFIEKDPYLDILREHIGEKAAEKFIHLLAKKDSNKPEEITENLGSVRNIFDNILKVIAKKCNAPDWCLNKNNPDQIIMRAIIGWINPFDKINKKVNYQYDSNSLIKNFLYDIQEIASDFGPHDDLTPKPSGYQPTSNTVNSLIYALKDIILWFGKICNP